MVLTYSKASGLLRLQSYRLEVVTWWLQQVIRAKRKRIRLSGLCLTAALCQDSIHLDLNAVTVGRELEQGGNQRLPLVRRTFARRQGHNLRLASFLVHGFRDNGRSAAGDGVVVLLNMGRPETPSSIRLDLFHCTLAR